MVTGNWMWYTYNVQQLQIFVVDAFWFVTSLISLLVFLRLKTRLPGPLLEKEAPSEACELVEASTF